MSSLKLKSNFTNNHRVMRLDSTRRGPGERRGHAIRHDAHRGAACHVRRAMRRLENKERQQKGEITSATSEGNAGIHQASKIP